MVSVRRVKKVCWCRRTTKVTGKVQQDATSIQSVWCVAFDRACHGKCAVLEGSLSRVLQLEPVIGLSAQSFCRTASLALAVRILSI